MAGFDALAGFDLAEGMDGGEFVFSESRFGDEGEVVEAAIVVLVGGQEVGVAVVGDRGAIGLLAGEDGGFAFDTITAGGDGSEDAHEVAACGLGDGQGVRDEGEDAGVEGKAGDLRERGGFFGAAGSGDDFETFRRAGVTHPAGARSLRPFFFVKPEGFAADMPIGIVVRDFQLDSGFAFAGFDSGFWGVGGEKGAHRIGAVHTNNLGILLWALCA